LLLDELTWTLILHTRQAVGTVLDAVELVLQGKYSTTFSVIRPPGHHAGRDGNAMDAPSQGFCLFNNAAVGALKAKQLMDARVTSVQSPSARSQAISNAVAAGHRILVYDVRKY
jgi:acetoin utilization deacetylase AcuC-like enzyme